MFWSEDSNIRNWLPKLQAHRGYWINGATQNSLTSIMEAYKIGYEMAEFDIRMTSDGVIILFHDMQFQNKIVSQTSFQELNSVITLTPLEDLFRWFVKTEKFKLNIEVKSRDIIKVQFEKKIAELIEKYNIEDRVLVSSFNPLSLFKMSLFSPKLRRALLLTFEKEHGNNIIIKSLIFNFLCRPHILNLRSEDYSAKFRKLTEKIPIVLWTVNNLEIYNKNKDEIHGIISDSITPSDFKI